MDFTIERRSGGYRALAYGTNHEKIMWSEVYTTKRSAQHAINLMKVYAATAQVFDRT
jgi:uncharacterized protein YegP (UPF0339 family)